MMNIDNIRLYFNDAGFDLESISDTMFLAQKKGSNLIFLRYTDYYFVHYLESISLGQIIEKHETSKIIANKDFKVPKALRLSVPNINTVLICNENLSNDIIDFVTKRNLNLVGGQQESIFVLDTLGNKMYSAGKELTHISGEAKLIWGNKKEFKTLNGHNRSYMLMKDLFKYLSQ